MVYSVFPFVSSMGGEAGKMLINVHMLLQESVWVVREPLRRERSNMVWR